MNDLQKYFNNNTGRTLNKWSHYFEIYDRHFSKYRGKPIVLLEIGTFHGGSLQMWRDYFGKEAKIYGIDINPNCVEAEDENIKVMIGSQSDPDFLRKVKLEIPPIDILIDDGGHTMLQQIVSFQELFDHVKPDGTYLCEDLHTSYWTKFGGGYKRAGSFIEYSKNFIDKINAYHSQQSALKVTPFTQSVNSLHYYDSVLVIEKRPTPKPTEKMMGTLTIPFYQPELTKFGAFVKQQKYYLRYLLNLSLAAFRLPYKKGNFD